MTRWGDGMGDPPPFAPHKDDIDRTRQSSGVSLEPPPYNEQER